MMLVARINNKITCSYPEMYWDHNQLGNILTSLLEEVVIVTGVTYNELFLVTRLRRIVMARNLYCFIARKHLRLFTLHQIADVFNISHCTVIHACKNIENALQLRDDASRKLQDQYLEILGFDNSTIVYCRIVELAH